MFNLVFLFIFNYCFADTRYSFESFLYAQRNQPADSIINPGNQVLRVAAGEYHLDLRGEIKWRTDEMQFVLRPRFLGYQNNIEFNNQTEVEAKGELDLTDAFYEHFWTPKLFSTIGLQVYQWGPAEFINASNPLYHFNPRQKSAVYKEKGQILLRLNFSPSKESNFIFIVQPVSNNEPEWIAEDTFTPKAVLKWEKTGKVATDYFGLVAGSEEKSNLYFGEYFSYSIIEGFSLYGDLKHAQNRINYIPEVNGAMVNLVPETHSGDQWPTLAVLGARWEDSYDVRLEYIYNGMGLTASDLNYAVASISNFANPGYPQNVARFLRPGLELLGQNYLYASYRISDPFRFKDLNLYFRYIRSLQDESSQMQFEFDRALWDSFLIFSNVSFSNGNLDSEFRLLNDWQAMIGLKWGI